jgi:hypothetical protein
MNIKLDNFCSKGNMFALYFPLPVRRAFWALLLVGCWLGTSLAAMAQTPQQEDDYGTIRRRPVEITRVRTRRPVRVPLLGLQWQLLAYDKQGVERPVDLSNGQLVDGEGVRLVAQNNQTGYVYVISQTIGREKSASAPQLIFSKNDVVAEDTVIELPTSGQSKSRQNDKYWWKKESSTEHMVFTIIFSRDKIEELTNTLNQAGGPSNYRLLLDLIQRSSFPEHRISKPGLLKQQKSQGIDGPFVTSVWNANRTNNEMLVEIIEFKRK